MAFPLILGHENSELGICREVFTEAHMLFQRDSFQEALNVLKKGQMELVELSPEGVQPLFDVLALVGHCIFGLRDFKSLDAFLKEMQELGYSGEPEIQLLQAYKMMIKGQAPAAMTLCQDFLEEHRPNIHPLAGDFLLAHGHCGSQAGHQDLPNESFEAAYGIFHVQGRKFEIARTANVFGFHYLRTGRYQKATEWFSKAQTIFENLNLPRRLSVVYLHQGIAQYKLGQLALSAENLQKSLALGVEGDWTHRQCFANIALGNVYRMMRDFEAAQNHLTKGYTQAQTKFMAREESLALEFLGDVYRDQGKLADAIRFYDRAMAISEPLAPEGDVVAEIHRRRGECDCRQGNYVKSKKALKRSLELTRNMGDRYEEGTVLRGLAELAVAQQRYGDAQGLIQSSCDIFEEIGAQLELATSRLYQAEIFMANRPVDLIERPDMLRLNQAWHCATDALKIFLKIDISYWIGKANGAVKRVTALRKDLEAKQIKSSRAKSTEISGDVIIYKSQEMAQVLELCDLYAEYPNPLLIFGKTGTGKELIARRIHQNSGREGTLVSVNVASIAPSLFEREFFGHVKGAFSGADENRIGYAERADGGTLFLDEIGDLPLELQPKLLRLLQDGRFHAVGDPDERQVDCRLVAATNVDLAQASMEGKFRQDLYYRLRGLTLNIPALSERQGDIVPLMEHFLSLSANESRKVTDYLNPASLELVREYSWPGNIRELISVCQQLHLQLAARGKVRVELGLPGAIDQVLTGPVLQEGFQEGLQEMAASAGGCCDQDAGIDYRRRIALALHRNGGSRSKAAVDLKMSRSTLYRKMKKYGL